MVTISTKCTVTPISSRTFPTAHSSLSAIAASTFISHVHVCTLIMAAFSFISDSFICFSCVKLNVVIMFTKIKSCLILPWPKMFVIPNLTCRSANVFLYIPGESAFTVSPFAIAIYGNTITTWTTAMIL